MGKAPRRTVGAQTGPRSTRVVTSVRSATLAELDRVGFADLTMDGVARAAGVNRSTLYRRWPTKAALLADVMEPLLEDYDGIQPTDSLYADLFALMAMMRGNTARPEGRALFTAIHQRSDELRDAVDELSRRTLAAFLRLMEAGRVRGEVTAEDDEEISAYLAFYGLGMWEHSHRTPPTDADLHRILRAVLASFARVKMPKVEHSGDV